MVPWKRKRSWCILAKPRKRHFATENGRVPLLAESLNAAPGWKNRASPAEVLTEAAAQPGRVEC